MHCPYPWNSYFMEPGDFQGWWKSRTVWEKLCRYSGAVKERGFCRGSFQPPKHHLLCQRNSLLPCIFCLSSSSSLSLFPLSPKHSTLSFTFLLPLPSFLLSFWSPCGNIPNSPQPLTSSALKPPVKFPLLIVASEHLCSHSISYSSFLLSATRQNHQQ